MRRFVELRRTNRKVRYQAGRTLSVSARWRVRQSGHPAGRYSARSRPEPRRGCSASNARGAINAGQFADIIATPENPLDNISTLKQVNFVLKNGKVFKGAK